MDAATGPTRPSGLPDDFEFAEDPDNPGWWSWKLREQQRYNSTLGPMWVRRREDGSVVVRTRPGHLQGNLGNNVHGGAILTQIDISLFVCARLNGALETGPGVTLDLNTHFLGAGRVGEPLDVETEILRETGRLLFMRGLAVQNDIRIASFSGTIRKLGRPKA